MSAAKHLLFKRERATKVTTSAANLYTWFLGAEPGESWKDDADGSDKKDGDAKEALVFVAECESPKDVAKIVRKEPLTKYVLFVGEVHEITVALPVFIGGKAAATMDKEWA